MNQPYPPQPYPPQPYPPQAQPQQYYPPQHDPQQHMPQTAAPAQYEFSDQENKTIGVTASRAQAWGLISLLLGVGQLALSQMNTARASTFVMATQLAGGVVSIIVGAVFLGVATSLQSVVKSRGNDVALMMSALSKLSMALTIQVVVAIAGFAVGFVCGALGIT